MPGPKLTAKAFAALYSRQLVVLVGADAVGTLERLVPSGLCALSLHGDGLVSLPSEQPGQGQNGLHPIGLPLALKAIVSTSGTGLAARDWLAFCDSQKPFTMPRHTVLPRLPGKRAAVAAACFQALLAETVAELQGRLADKERQVVHLRHKAERLLTEREKARSIIGALGGTPQYIVADVPAGAMTLGPGGDVNVRTFTQALPCDAYALSGLSVKVAKAAGRSDGVLSVAVRNLSDNSILGAADIGFSELSDGWCRLEIGDIRADTFGDAAIDISWHLEAGAQKGVPRLCLADAVADRFGDADGRTLALRVTKGFMDTESLSDADEPCLAWQHNDIASYFRQASYAFGADALEQATVALGHPPLELDSTSASVSLSAAMGKAAGLLLPGFVAADTREISVRFDQISGGACLALMVVQNDPEATPVKKARNLEKFASGFASEKNIAPTGVTADGRFAWAGAVIGAGQQCLSLALEGTMGAPADLSLIVVPLSDDGDAPTCRWHRVARGRPLPTAAVLEPQAVAGGEDHGALRAVLPVSFPELAERLQYWRGDADHTALARKHGFAPLSVNNERNYLQTHALAQGLSGCIVAAVLPASTEGVTCRVETAHGAAPRMTYIMMAVPKDTVAATDAIDRVAAAIDPARTDTLSGQDAQTGISWVAKEIAARVTANLELDLGAPTLDAADLFLGVKSMSGGVSYAWCRWYDLGIVTRDVAATRVVLKRMADRP